MTWHDPALEWWCHDNRLGRDDISRLFVQLLRSVVLQILVVMGLLMRIIHVFPALAGLTVTVILVPITTVVSRRLAKVRRALIKCTDDRVKLVTEVITGNWIPVSVWHLLLRLFC